MTAQGNNNISYLFFWFLWGFFGETDGEMTLGTYERFILIKLELKSLCSEMARKKNSFW